LEDNIKALTHSLTPEQIEELESVYPYVPHFPMSHFGVDLHEAGKTTNAFIGSASPIQWVQHTKAPRPESA
jgi:hypothetical protein